MVQFLHVKSRNGGSLFIVGKSGNGIQMGIVGYRVPVVVQPECIVANGVHGGYVALVLHGACCHEGVPVLYAYLRPVGANEEDIVVVPRAVACPYRETQVIADEHLQPHALVGESVPFLGGGEESVLASVGIEMAFVLYLYGFKGLYQKAAIGQSFVRAADERARHGYLIAVGSVLQGVHSLAVHGFGEVGSVSTEAGGKHLRQQSHIGHSSQCGKALGGGVQVRLFVHPRNGILQQCDAEHPFYFFLVSAGLPIASRIEVSAWIFCIR